jgi:hypothetical protein
MHLHPLVYASLGILLMLLIFSWTACKISTFVGR